MKVRIKASENYQEVVCDIEITDYSQITDCLIQLRQAIKNGTQDIQSKKKVEEEKPSIKLATRGQINYLHNLGWSGNTEELTFDDASKIISQMGGGELRGQ